MLIQQLDIFKEKLSINLGEGHSGWGTKSLHELQLNDDVADTMNRLHKSKTSKE